MVETIPGQNRKMALCCVRGMAYRVGVELAGNGLNMWNGTWYILEAFRYIVTVYRWGDIRIPQGLTA